MRLKIFFIISMFILLFPATGETPEETIKNVLILGNGSNIYIDAVFTINTSRGIKEREIEAAVSRDNDETKIFIRIVAPAFLNKMKYLTIKDSSGIAQSWLATSRGVRRISGGNRNEPLFDSDFTAGDLSAVEVDDFIMTDEGLKNIKGHSCRTIRARPRTAGYEEAWRTYYVDGTFLRGIDYCHSDGTVYKEYRVETEQIVNGILMPELCSMKNIEKNTNTDLVFNNFRNVESIPSRIFSRGNL